MTCYSVQVLIRDQNEKAMENKCVEPKAHSPFRFMISTIDVDQFKGSRVYVTSEGDNEKQCYLRCELYRIIYKMRIKKLEKDLNFLRKVMTIARSISCQ